jgi:hypothetical protein
MPLKLLLTVVTTRVPALKLKTSLFCPHSVLMCSLHNQVVPCRSVLFSTLIVPQLFKNFLLFDKPRQFTAACRRVGYLCLSGATSIHSTPSQNIYLRFILILFPIYAEVFEMASFSRVSPPKPRMQIASPCVPQAPPSAFLFITRTKITEERDHAAPLRAIFSSPHLPMLLPFRPKHLLQYSILRRPPPHSTSAYKQ